ncbi:MAG: protein translocase subunit SecF [Parcubacteria group bacterium]|nr:protein translocase subunit SecF [Parcubacteria group bacterium]
MFIIKYRKFFILLSVAFMLLSAASIVIWRPSFGIDFIGGAMFEVSYPEGRPDSALVRDALSVLGVVSIQEIGNNGYVIRTKNLTEKDREEAMSLLSFNGTKQVTEDRFSSIGPTIGAELRQKAWIAILAVIVAIILFIAFSFRRVTTALRASGIMEISSWTFGVAAVIALVHDIMIPTAVFAFLGRDIDTLFVMALLALLGFSVHDTIVVFDRVRENVILDREARTKKPFAEIVGQSISQTLIRSINTSVTVLFVLLTLFFIGAESTRYFALTLSIGVIAGTYSSIFFASPLLVLWAEYKAKRSA